MAYRRRLPKKENILWKGTLFLLVKKRSLLPLQIKKKPNFLPLYWNLISQENGEIWMRGYVGHTVGSEFVEEFRIKAYTRAFGLPEWALPYCSEGEYPICLQTPDNVVFLTTDSTEKRDKFLQCLSSHLPLSPNPEESFSRPDEYTRCYDEVQPGMRHSRSETNLRQDNMCYPRPRGHSYYANFDDGYEAVPLQAPRVPQRDNKPKNGASYYQEQEGSVTDKDDLSEASTVDKVDKLKSLPCREYEANINGTDSPPTRTSLLLLEFILTFKSQKFKRDLIILFDKNIDWKAVKLCLVEDKRITVAGLSGSMYKELHVGDIIETVNNNSVSSVNNFYDLIESSNTDKIELKILRVPDGCLCHVTLPANGQIDHLGVSFSKLEKCGVEVTKIDEAGLVFKSNQLPIACPAGVTDPTKRVNWGLVEVNQKPVPLNSSWTQVKELLAGAGIELALVLLPMDLVRLLKNSSCEN